MVGDVEWLNSWLPTAGGLGLYEVSNTEEGCSGSNVFDLLKQINPLYYKTEQCHQAPRIGMRLETTDASTIRVWALCFELHNSTSVTFNEACGPLLDVCV